MIMGVSAGVSVQLGGRIGILAGMAMFFAGGPCSAAQPASPLTPPLIHSHNDYERERPLQEALTHRFDSVEADIWLVKGQVMISHIGFRFRGTLKDLYLDPLQKKVDEKGSVYGDGKPFYLWIDIKDGNRELVDELHKLLGAYSMLTTFSDERVEQKPVTVILSGHDRQKKEYVDRYLVRKACRDSTQFHISDTLADNRWLWYSLRWSDLFKWKGTREIEARDQAVLLATVGYIHTKGRRVRFWDAPETNDFWRMATNAKVDILGTDHMTRLVQFVRGFFQIGPDRAPAQQ